MAVNNACLAQKNPHVQHSSNAQLGELLQVPKSPAPSKRQKPRSQTVPPPPLSSGEVTGVAVAVGGKPSFQSRQETPADDIKQLERGFLQEKTPGKVPKAPAKSVSPRPNVMAQNAQEQIRQFSGATSLGQPSIQTAPLPGTFGSTTTQEFTAPSTPTFNQLLNSQSQIQQAPLPPLPGTPTPTFNPPINSQTEIQSQVYNTNGVGATNQLLNAQSIPESSVSSAPATQTSNQSFNCQVVSSSPGSGTAAPTFNQVLNCQTTTVSSVPNTPAQTFNQLLNCQVVTSPSAFGTSTSSSNQLLNCQAVSSVAVPQGIPTAQIQAPATPAIPTDSTPSLSAAALNTPQPVDRSRPIIRSSALQEPSLQIQGVYITQGDDAAARARVAGVYPVSPQLLFGATLDFVSGDNILVDSRGEGLNINELFLATSIGGVPNLRFVLGQIDLTSYFDRNSFAKDGASQFFNSVFQTNPALSATGIASRAGLLVNWSVTDNIEAKAAVFSSSNKISDFTLDGFAGEVAVRYGNAIIRGTYASDRDAGIRDSFPESFGIARNTEGTIFGPQKDDREEAYGLNAEVFVPNLKLGIFGRYGRYENRDLGKGADTYSLGLSFLDLFTPDDRLGLAYGRGLTNESLRRGDNPDVLELFYDFKFLPNLRLGFTVQGRDSFEETVLGVRVLTDFDVTPRGRRSQ
ncbi:porin [Brasilonema sp. UFV-L1]|uniref:porin n=1 Tax=Brasilonema sp. UFV-L1 TaxID=2234130 RepID=UPI0030DB83FD